MRTGTEKACGLVIVARAAMAKIFKNKPLCCWKEAQLEYIHSRSFPDHGLFDMRSLDGGSRRKPVVHLPGRRVCTYGSGQADLMTFADCLSAIISWAAQASTTTCAARLLFGRQRGVSDMHCLVGLLIVSKEQGFR